MHLPPVRKRRPPFHRRHTAEQGLIEEIMSAARAIAEARDWNGEAAFPTDGVSRVLAAIDRSPYCLAIADLGRVLGIRKQSAQEFAHAAERAGFIELAPNADDRRILQALLTPRGRRELAAAKRTQTIWRAALRNGLSDHPLATATHVVRTIRQRLERDARELAPPLRDRVGAAPRDGVGAAK